MANYTVDPTLSQGPTVSVRAWLLSFAAANLTMAALMLFLLPLLKTPTPVLADQATMVEWLPAEASEPPTPAAATAATAEPQPAPTQPTPPPPAVTPPHETPPPPAPSSAAPEEPPAQQTDPEKSTLTVRPDATPLAYNQTTSRDTAPPPQARFAGEDNAQAQSRKPTPGATDPVPTQPNGVAAQVLATGTVGDAPEGNTGITLQETRNPGNPEQPTGANQPPTASAPTAHPATPAAATPPNGGTAAGQAPATTPTPEPPTPASQTAPVTGAQAGIGSGPPPPQAGQPNPPPVSAPPKHPVPTPPTAQNGQAPNGQGASLTSTTANGQGQGDQGGGTGAGPAAGSLAAELARLEALKAADQAQGGGDPGRKSTVDIQQPPTQGDPSAVTKTPLFTLRLNAGTAGPDTIETFKDPTAKYLKDFRRILEQNFYREAGLPRSYKFRDGEYADFEMTFHTDGSIDGVALIPKTGTAQFSAEMETICKTAIARSSPYNAFTDELRKQCNQFKLIVRFQF